MFDIYLFRKERGLRQDEFADKTGIARSYISRMEGKKQPITDAVLDKIARAFSVDLEGYKSYNQSATTTTGSQEGEWKEKYIDLLERYNSLSDKLAKCLEDKDAIRIEYSTKVKFRDPTDKP